MNKMMIVSVLLAFATGCDNSADIAAIAQRVTVLEEKMATLETDLAEVKNTVADASAKAVAAESAANRAADIAQETNNKVSQIFKQACKDGC